MTARLLLARQLRLLEGVDWTVVTGDAFEDAPADLEVDVVAMRREVALSDFSSFFELLSPLSGQALRFRPDPYAQAVVARTTGGPFEPHTVDLHNPRIAVLQGQRSAGQRCRLVFRALVLHVGHPCRGPIARRRGRPPHGQDLLGQEALPRGQRHRHRALRRWGRTGDAARPRPKTRARPGRPTKDRSSSWSAGWCARRGATIF